MLKITKTEPAKVSSIHCPDCNEKLARVGLLVDSEIKGLTFKCKRCGGLYAVTAGDTTE